MDAYGWLILTTSCTALAVLLTFSLMSYRRPLHIVLFALALSGILNVLHGVATGYGAWDAKSVLAGIFTGQVLYGVPMLGAAFAIIRVNDHVRSRVVVSIVALAVATLAAIPGSLVALAVWCGWTGDCI
jgi:hypothetical protein